LGLACNEGLQPVRAPTACPPGFVGICGTVRFRGALPDSTQAVYLVAYPTFPRTRNDLFNFVPLPPQSIPTADSTYFYTLGIPTGRYEWVLAAWVKQGFTTANADTTLREAGFYRDKADTTKPGVVSVYGTGTDSISWWISRTCIRSRTTSRRRCGRENPRPRSLRPRGDSSGTGNR
jgi:hypothetical protein